MTTNTKQIKLFIGCLPSDTIPEEISQYFSKYCIKIEDLEVKVRKNGVCAGFGHLGCLISIQQLQKVTSETHVYRGRTLEVRQYLSEEELKEVAEELRKRKIHVSNLPKSATDEDLLHLFEAFGEIERAYLANKNPKKEDIYGFVVFKSPKCIRAALNAQLTFKGAKVIVNTTTPKVKPVGETAKTDKKKKVKSQKKQFTPNTRSSSFESNERLESANQQLLSALLVMQSNLQSFNLVSNQPIFPPQISGQERQRTEFLNMPAAQLLQERAMLELEYNKSPSKEDGKRHQVGSSTKMSKVLKVSRDIALNHVSWNVRTAPRPIIY